MLQDKELKKISLGYEWNSEMSIDEFLKINKLIDSDNGIEIYENINRRYVYQKYEE
jgi:hypothetical protein